MVLTQQKHEKKLRSANNLLKRGKVKLALLKLRKLAKSLQRTPLAPIYAETLLILGSAEQLAYSYSALRDLLFHVQEHQFTIPQLQSLLNKFNLEFLGFFVPQTIREEYSRIFPDDPDRLNLEHWHQYEQAHPFAFITMYNFHCCRVNIS